MNTICSRCRKSTASKANFCSNCGAQLSAQTNTAERRQLTFLSCDMVESTALSERLDPEEMRKLIRECRDICRNVARRDDENIKLEYAGDGVLIYFGYPDAHEDEARRAVSNALEILARIRILSSRFRQQSGLLLSVRIGVHTGEVVVGEIGSGDSSEPPTAVGEAPNLADRIQKLADPDTIAISETTHQLVEPFFIFHDLGFYTIRGKTQRVRLYRVLGETGAHTRMEAAAIRGLTPLVGRKREKQFLLDCWEKAKSGHAQSVLLYGEAGIGKSRVIEELKQHLRGERYNLLETYCSLYQKNTAFAPITGLLSRAMKIADDDPPEKKLANVNRTMGNLESNYQEIVPLIAQLLSIPLTPENQSVGLTPIRQRQIILETLIAWLVREAKDSPLVFVMEDVHWADPSTLELLILLMSRHRAQRLMILVTFRPDISVEWPVHENVHKIELERLPPGESAVLATHVAQQRALSTKVLRFIDDRTRGVPLFVEEMTKMLLQRQFLKETEGSYELVGNLPDLPIPATLKGLLTAALDRLDSAKIVAQWAATLGHEFSYDVLKAVSKIPKKQLKRDLGRLIKADLISVNRSVPNSSYVFKHALIRDAAYDLLLIEKRKLYHQKTAEVLKKKFRQLGMTSPELIAHHFTEAGFNKEGLPYWEKAAKRAFKRAANQEASKHLEMALEALKKPPKYHHSQAIELRLQLSLMAAHSAIRGWAAEEVEKCCVQARDLGMALRDYKRLAAAIWGLWTVHFLRGDLDAALEIANQVLVMAMAADVKMLKVMAHHAVGFTRHFRGELLESKAHACDGIALFDLETERDIVNAFQFSSTMALRFFLSTNLWFLGKAEESQNELDRASSLILGLNHAPSHAAFTAFKLSFYLYHRDTMSMKDAAAVLKQTCLENGFRLYVPVAMMYTGWALVQEGKVDEGLGLIEQGVTEYRSTGSMIKLVEVQAMYAEVLWRAGRIESALAALEEGIDQANRRQEHLFEPELYRIRGEIYLQQGNKIAAEKDFDQALRIARSQGALSLELRALMSKCRLLRVEGHLRQASQKLIEIYGSFTEGFNTNDLVEAKNLIEELTVH